MSVAIPFGDNAHARCDIAPELVLANLKPNAPRLASLEQAVFDALADPRGYPPLSQATVPGDKVVFALGKEVVPREPIVRALLEYVAQFQLTDRQIQLLLPQGVLPTEITALRQLVDERGQAVEIVVHAPQDQKENAFLTSSHDNRAIVLNRHLCDADVVVPIDVARARDSFNYFGPYSSIFPTYADIDSQQRWNSPLFVTRIERRKRRLREVEEVRQLLGIVYNLLLIPAEGGGFGSAIFGEANHVSKATAQQLRSSWEPDVPQLAGVVIALLTGGGEGQTWEKAARALAHVENLVRPDGAIVLCTEIRERPGPALSQMGQSLEFTDFEGEMRKSRLNDAAIALQFAKTLSQCKLYFRSRLPEAILDELDLIPVETDEECRKICEYYRDVVIVHDAQDLAVAVADPSHL